jgi:hypothetical protein
MTKLEIILGAVVLGLIAFIAWSFWERHEGSVSCIDADKVAVATQEAHNAAILVNQQQTIAQEKKAYEDALLQPVAAPVVRLCIPAGTLPQTIHAAPGAHAAPALPAGGPINPVPDVGRPLMQQGHDADAQVIALQDYIKNVCLK